MRLVVSYDVCDNRRRRRLAKRLKDHLRRVQFSVFEGEVRPDQLQAIMKMAEEELDFTQDSVRVYHLCRACKGMVRALGTSLMVIEDGDEVL